MCVCLWVSVWEMRNATYDPALKDCWRYLVYRGTSLIMNSPPP